MRSMSVRERPRKDEEEKQEKSEVATPKQAKTNVLGEKSKEVMLPVQEVPSQASEVLEEGPLAIPFEERYRNFLKNLPSWIKVPWVYVTPKLEAQKRNWLDNWTSLLLDYCHTTITHVITLEEIRRLHPFKNKDNGRSLSLEQLKQVIYDLEEKKLARWLEPEIRARIYWKTNEVFAQELYNYMINTGKAIEYWTLLDLKKEYQEWSNLPLDELRAVIDVLVNKKLAKWLDSEKTTIQFLI